MRHFKNVVDEDFEEIFAKYRGRAPNFWGEKDDTSNFHFFAGGKDWLPFIKNSKPPYI